MENKLQEIKEFLLKRRDLEKANLQQNAINDEGYFDVDGYSGGNFDDCFNMGIEVGEAEFIEELLSVLEK